jgi:hypothetical protein
MSQISSLQRATRSPRSRRALSSWIVGALALVGASCRRDSTTDITVVVEDGKSKKAQFTPRSAFAEYFSLPENRNELRIFLADYETSCAEYTGPGENETLVTILVLTPPDKPPGAAMYPVEETPQQGTPIESAFAVPRAQLGKRGHLFQPGGTLKLTELDLSDHGKVAGLIDARFAGDPTHAASSLEGSFVGRICRFSLAPER